MRGRSGRGGRAVLAGLLVFGGATATSVVGATLPASAATVVHGDGHGGGAGASTSFPARRIGQAPVAPAGTVGQGALAATTAIHADVELLPRNPSALSNFATAVSTPGNPLYRHFITPSQFTSQFGPTATVVSATEKRLAALGLTVGRISANHLTLPVSGTATKFEQAFSTGFERYRIADGRLAFANTEAPLLSGNLAGSVQGVIGLDDVNVSKPLGLRPGVTPPQPKKASPDVDTGGPQPCPAAVAAAPGQDAVHGGPDRVGCTFSPTSTRLVTRAQA